MTWWDRNIYQVKQVAISVAVVVFMLSVVVLAVWAISGFNFERSPVTRLDIDLPEGCLSAYDGLLLPPATLAGIQLFELAGRNIPINDSQYITKEGAVFVALRYIDAYTVVSGILGACINEDGQTILIFSDIELVEPNLDEESS